MKRQAIMLVPGLALLTLFGCAESSPRGGGMTSSDGFRVIAPAEIVLQQGAVQTIKVTLDRGDLFKQDVALDVKADRGINIDPANATIKASATPDALIKLGATKDAPLGEYRVTITGKPTAGALTMAELRVKVVAP